MNTAFAMHEFEEHKTESKCIAHEPCPSCGSKDNLGRYDDGHGYCYGCEYREPRTGDTTGTEGGSSVLGGGDLDCKGVFSPSRGTVSGIPYRGLDLETCKKYDYQLGEYNGNPCHIANYRDLKTKTIVAQKIRMAGKKFTITGDAKKMSLFGQHLFQGGKYLCITEGEIDCLSVSQVFGNKYPAVSLPNGAAAALKAIKNAYEWLENFETIVIMFDMDEPGRKAAQEVADMLPPGRARIANLPGKDANELLVAGKAKEILSAFWDAKPYRPDGIVMATDLREIIRANDQAVGVPYPFPTLNGILRGIRPAELVTITSGSGMGKTTFVRELAYHLHQVEQVPIGLIMLEESNRRTLEGMVGLHLDRNVLVDRSDVTEDNMMKGFDELFGERDIALYDHFGSTEIQNILNRIRYMVKVCGARYVFLDHLSILISGLASNDERKLIDMAMTALRTLVQETGAGLFLVSHLKRPQGDKGHEDGASVHLGQLRGSHAIAQLSDAVIGLQKPEDGSNEIELVVLKNRYSGEVGPAGTLDYNRATGRLTEGVF